MNFPRRIAYSSIILCTLLSIFAARNLNAQWRKVAQLNSLINTIFFNNEINGNLGLITTGRTSNDFALWRTSDGGGTWTQIKSIIGPASDFAFSDFTFKDAFTGWMSVTSSFGPLKTTDGGITWYSQSLPNTAHGGIFYNKRNKVLIQNGGGYASGNSFISTDEGITWKIIPLGCDQGFSFFSTMQGVSGCSDAEITNDGGFTWHSVPNVSECYQPLALKNTSKCFFLSETSNLLYLSVDFGQSFSVRYDFTSFGSSLDVVTGCIRGDTNLLLIQSLLNGAFYSLNDGLSWINFCGPKNVYDTRFFVKGDSVFMGDTSGGLWLNTTGIGSNSTPQLSLTNVNAAPLNNCQNFDTTLSITFFDSCNGIQAQLVSASISGSNNFLFSSPSAIPRTIHPDDSLLISYNPNSSSPDTSQLHLRFHLGWKDFDTTIQLFGSGRIPKENVQFIPTLSTNTASAGMLIDLSVKPDKIITGKALHSISFDLNYIGDLLNYNSVLSNNPLAILTKGTITHNGRIETLPITITGNDLSLDPSQAIADIKFQVMLTDTAKTSITINNLKLNGGDADYQNCILSADTSTTNFMLNFQCGDTTLYNYLRTGTLISILSMRPNPAQDEIEIALQSGLKQDANVEIFNALGARVYFGAKNLVVGENKVHLDTKGLSSGVYLVRVGNVSQSLVISR